MVASKLGVGASVATGTRAAMHNGFSLSSHLVPFLLGSKYIRLRNLFFYDPLVAGTTEDARVHNRRRQTAAGWAGLGQGWSW